MFDTETWKFINTFAPWLSALGTFTAVFVALYLASRDRQIKLRVYAGVMVIATAGKPPAENEECVLINAVNLGRREVTITNIGWSTGLFRKRFFVQMFPPHYLSSKMPIRLHDGEEASYYIPLEKTDNWASRFSQRHLLRYPRLTSRFIKVRVHTSIGKVFESRIEPSLRKELIDKAIKHGVNEHR